MRTARRMGVETIAVYSDGDARAPFVSEADRSIRVGAAPAAESYLNIERILSAASESGADSIHPGYGFLSENADFAEAVIAAGLIWVGAPPAAIRAMGLKDAAKALMAAADVPVTPGYQGPDQSDERLHAEASRIGYPVLIKAVAGGGGKGMRRVDTSADFPAALASCRREAASSFGDDRVLIETYVSRPRHIEVQVFGDRFGNVVHLFERDCSLQRRHQKVIEEAPAPGIDAAVRAAVCGAAVKAARAVRYEGAGTIEFIADASEGLRADRIWFMEMNTRLQVEHPVTEAVTGLDLVEWQLRVASGEPLPASQEDIRLEGCAIEARLYAENSASGFLPSIGPLTHFRLPDNVRVESAVEEGDEVTPFYDAMIAKLITHAPTRHLAALKLAKACRAVEVWPVKTNAPLLARCLEEPAFIDGQVDTDFIASRSASLVQVAPPSTAALKAAARRRISADLSDLAEPWHALHGFRVNALPAAIVWLRYESEIQEISVDLPIGRAEPPSIRIDGTIVVFDGGEAYVFTDPAPSEALEESNFDGAILAPMPGRVVHVSVAKGDRVSKGQPLLTMEAMKTEHTLTAPFDGTIADLPVQSGTQVSEGTLLVRLQRID
jgi:acetyl/propionyl-CoA carboxylase alpha subunit